MFLLILPNLLLANNEDEIFRKANAHYQNERYDKAITAYEELLETDWRSAELYYNLGNAYFRTDSLGKAILNFERALIQKPNFKDAAFNLSFAQGKLKDDFEKISPFFLKRWWQGLQQSASSNVWGLVAILTLWLGITGMVLWLFSKNRSHRKMGFFGGIVLLLLSIIPYALASDKAKFEKATGKAIILKKEIALNAGPDESSLEILLLHEGTKVELLDKIEDWNKVKLSNGEEGWLPMESLEEI